MNDEDIRKAAKSFARIKVKNSIMKYVAIGGVLFIATFIGLMIGSVILGMEATKDFKVKEQVLLQNNENGTALGTSEAFYSFNLKLTTPLSTIKGIKSLKFSSKNGGTLQFTVVSFYYIPGRTLTFYGVNHVAEVLFDGSVEVYPISTSNGERSVDENKRNSYTDVSGTGTSLSTNGVKRVYEINQCSDLLLIQETGSYGLTNSIDCTLLQPLLSLSGQSFRGTINGNGHYISININGNGPVALFRTLKQATIINLLLKGNITGVQNCGGIAVETYPGTTFISTGVYANIQCSNNQNKTTTIGAFSSLLRSESNDDQRPVSFSDSVSQSHYTLLLSDLSYFNLQGGFYGAALESVITNFNFSYSASTPKQRGGSYRNDLFGFKAVPHTSTSHTEKKSHVYIPENCYNYNKTNSKYINMCVEFFKENSYEESCCCASVNFDSCPYINCSNQSKVCMGCRRGKSKNEVEKKEEESQSGSFESDPVHIVPTIRKLCSSN